MHLRQSFATLRAIRHLSPTTVSVLVLLVVGSTQLLGAQAVKTKPPVPKPVAVLSPEETVMRALQKQSDAFFDIWGAMWRKSQMDRWPGPNDEKFNAPYRQNPTRYRYQHCHAPEFAETREQGVKLDGEYSPVRSASAFSMCPTWILGENGEYIKGQTADEADSADAPINRILLDSVRSSRARLINEFDRAQIALPNNPGLFGQRVRLLLDQGMRDSATSVARSCTGDVVFCLLLRGYVESRHKNVVSASMLFDSETAQMDRDERCGWRDITGLIEDSLRARYTELTCAPRQAYIKRYFWLADPLYSDSLNERLAEHQAREVRMMLASALPRDGRYFYWETDRPTLALRKLVARYGWPTYFGWGGTSEDRSHDTWLKRFGVTPQTPYTTFEYSDGRIHTAPPLSVQYSPFTATDSSWELNGNLTLNVKDRAKEEKEPERWWPEEHFKRARKLITLPTHQIAVLRRANDLLLATAHDVTSPELSGIRSNGIATLIVTPDPDTIVTIGKVTISNNPTVRMQAHIPSAPTMIALEMSDPNPDGIDARTRIGVHPPGALIAMTTGEIALSDPIVLQMTASDQGLPAPGEELLKRMLGTTTISLEANPRIGVFFESYGVAEKDTVTVSVRLERRESLNAFRRLGIAMNVAGDPNASVTISWKEPNIAHVVRTVGGNVPIQSRAIAIDISNLTAGPYDVVTGIKRGAQPEVTSRRRVTIVK